MSVCGFLFIYLETACAECVVAVGRHRKARPPCLIKELENDRVQKEEVVWGMVCFVF